MEHYIFGLLVSITTATLMLGLMMAGIFVRETKGNQR